MNPLLKALLDFGPLLVFFLANLVFGIFGATAAVMIAILISMSIEYIVERSISRTLLFNGVLVMLLGGLTLWLGNETFIKMKPTVLYAVFAAILLGGLAMKRLYIKNLLGQTVELPDSAWRTLTWRWAVFFIVIAVLNEIVRQSVSTDIWVAFKVWGIFPLTLLFALAQTPVFLRHQVTPEEPTRNM